MLKLNTLPPGLKDVALYGGMANSSFYVSYVSCRNNLEKRRILPKEADLIDLSRVWSIVRLFTAIKLQFPS
jgi:hypothetical protein